MGRKWSDKHGGYEVWEQIRHPISRQPKTRRRYRNERRQPIKTVAEARRIENKLRNEIFESFHLDLVPPWKKCCENAYRGMRERGLAEKTVINYEMCLSAHTYQKWASKRIDMITSQDIRDLINIDLADKSESHKLNMLKFLRAVFKQAMEDGAVVRCPVPDMRLGRKKVKIQKVLTEEQMEKLLNQSKNTESEWYEIWSAACYTGMRNGELYALPWENVDLERRLIYVKCGWDNVNGFKDYTKSGDDRVVEIAPPLLTILRELKLHNNDSPFVLPRLRKWDKGEQARELRLFLMGLGLPPVRFHDLRASWATLMLSKGIEPIKVMKMGGWKDIKTMQIYCRMDGIDIKGITDNLIIHSPSKNMAQVVPISQL